MREKCEFVSIHTFIRGAVLTYQMRQHVMACQAVTILSSIFWMLIYSVEDVKGWRIMNKISYVDTLTYVKLKTLSREKD